MSTRITATQKSRIVSLFQQGTSMKTLADTWEIPVERVEQIIRETLLAQEEVKK